MNSEGAALESYTASPKWEIDKIGTFQRQNKERNTRLATRTACKGAKCEGGPQQRLHLRTGGGGHATKSGSDINGGGSGGGEKEGGRSVSGYAPCTPALGCGSSVRGWSPRRRPSSLIAASQPPPAMAAAAAPAPLASPTAGGGPWPGVERLLLPLPDPSHEKGGGAKGTRDDDHNNNNNNHRVACCCRCRLRALTPPLSLGACHSVLRLRGGYGKAQPRVEVTPRLRRGGRRGQLGA